MRRCTSYGYYMIQISSLSPVITDRTKSHDRKKKVEKLSYLKKLQELKAKRSQNIKRRKSIEDGYKVTQLVLLSHSSIGIYSKKKRR